jgi:DNA-binding response OmpR family regulator
MLKKILVAGLRTMAEARILLVEGKRAGDESLEAPLCKAGYLVTVRHTGSAALSWVDSNGRNPDLVIFDGASMRSSGVRSCRRLRRALEGVPIIHTRAVDQPRDETAGADVYLVKPYTPRKVLNRVRALLPADASEEEMVSAGDLILYRGKRSVEVVGRGETQLTPKLACLLEDFLRHPNQVRTRRELMQNVWQTDYIGDTRTLDVHVRWVREAIEADPSKPQRLITVRGKGYVLRVPPLA